MIDELLPPEVHCDVAFGDPPDAVLLTEEESLVERAVPKRRLEFTTVRHLARSALARLGYGPVPLLRGEHGAPLWPEGVVGSMTHCDGYRAAAVADARVIGSLGIDAEPHAPLPDGVLDAVSLPVERTHLARLLDSHPDVCWDRLLFSAKESVYKAWFPLTRSRLGFEDAELTFHPRERTFSALILPSGHDSARTTGATAKKPPEGLVGRWTVREGLVVTAIAQTQAT